MLQGVSISPGFAVGKAYCLNKIKPENTKPYSISDSDVSLEIERFRVSIRISKLEIKQLLRMPHIRDSSEISKIFQAHLALIDDPELQKEIIKRIETTKLDVISVVDAVIKEYSNFFNNLPDPNFRSKAIDITDIGTRIIKNCRDPKSSIFEFKANSDAILLADDLTPSEVIYYSTYNLLGIAIEQGTVTSHAAILARSLGIPTLIQVSDLLKNAKTGDCVVIDGFEAKVIINPTENAKSLYLEKQNIFHSKKQLLAAEITAPSQTKDNVRIKLMANISQLQEVETVINNNASGIGLYRTEFAYITSKEFPKEEELYNTYLSVFNAMPNSEVIIRTIDIGGDKISHLQTSSVEPNPVLGWRAIRMSLDCKEVFYTQLRAIVRAAANSVSGEANILFPMISNLTELRKAKQTLNKVISDLKNENHPLPRSIKTGIMIEIPSVAILAEKFAPEVDFFSIGSNDLIQYTLAVDRTNSKVSHLYQPANPAVLYLIDKVVKVANKYSKDLSLCGEMAGDSRYTLLLLGLGIQKFSMNSNLISSVKHIIRKVSLSETSKLIQPLLSLSTSEEIERELEKLNTEYA